MNSNQLFPAPGGGNVGLPDLSYAQFLSHYFGLTVGKIQTVSLGDVNEFAHGKGDTQFLNLAFNVNPTILVVPYSTLGAGAILLPTADPNEAMVSFLVTSATGSATTSGFEDLNGALFMTQGRVRTGFFGLGGHQLLGALYSNKQYTSLDQRLDSIIGNGKLKKHDGTWALPVGRRIGGAHPAGADDERRRRSLHTQQRCSRQGRQPLPGRQGGATHGWQGGRRQSRHRAHGRAGQPAARHGDDQRDDDHRVVGVRGGQQDRTGDIWAVDQGKNQLVHLPNGDPSKARIYCQSKSKNPLENPCGLAVPFHLAIDNQDRIWVSNNIGSSVIRFHVSDPTKVEKFDVGYGGSGLAIDSQGNVWHADRFGSSEYGRLKLVETMAAYAVEGEVPATEVLVHRLSAQKPGYWDGGSVSVLLPDGSKAPFSPVTGKGLGGPWAVAVDGNDNVWVSNFTSAMAGSLVQLCGFRTDTCPPGMKTGDAISPAGGYVGGGMQQLVDVGVGPAGDVWVTNNWEIDAAGLGQAPEALSTRALVRAWWSSMEWRSPFACR